MKCPICNEETMGWDTQQWGPEFAHIRCVVAYNHGMSDEKARQRVANSRPLSEYLADRIANMTPEQLAELEAARVRIKAAIQAPIAHEQEQA